MNILLTGATGFVGSAIASELSSNEKMNLYCLSSKQAVGVSNSAEYKSVDITEYDSFSALENIKELNAVIHCAGLAHQFDGGASERFFDVNVEGTRNVLRFAAETGVKHFVQISSVSVYGNVSQDANKKHTDSKKSETDACAPETPYAKSKLAAEELAINYCGENKIALTILRLATVIGEGDRGNVFRLIKAIDENKFLMIGRGDNCKTLIYKRDVAKACRLILEKKDLSDKAVEIFNVGAEPVPMKTVVYEISNSLSKKRRRFYIPLKMVETSLNVLGALFPAKIIKNLSDTLSKWTSDEQFSSEKIESRYRFKPETTISEAIKREARFYKRWEC